MCSNCNTYDNKYGTCRRPQNGVSSALRINVNTQYTYGYLANGSKVSVDNILNILSLIEKRFPQDTSWGTYANGGDEYFYASPENPAPMGGGCNAFAGMVADLIYGKGAPYTAHSDFSRIKTGDVVHLKNNATGVDHWLVVGEMTEKGYLRCEGNAAAMVSWDGKSDPIEQGVNIPNSTIYSFY